MLKNNWLTRGFPSQFKRRITEQKTCMQLLYDVSGNLFFSQSSKADSNHSTDLQFNCDQSGVFYHNNKKA